MRGDRIASANTERVSTGYLKLLERLRRGDKLGWKTEDARLTPGIPRLGIRNPAGEPVGVCMWWFSEETKDKINDFLDEVGYPK